MDAATWMSWAGVMAPQVYSPGPANMALAASGAQAGLRRSLPFLLGVEAGFLAQSLLLGAGLHQAFERWPVLLLALKAGGVVYLLWLTGKLFAARNAPLRLPAETAPRRLRGIDGLTLLALNPKAWLMQCVMFSQFVPPEAGYGRLAALTAALAAMNLSAHVLWLAGGNTLARRLPPRHHALLNLGFCLLLLATVLALATDLWRQIGAEAV